MSNLPLGLRRSLAEAGARVTRLQLLERRDSDTGMAVKFIFGDGEGAQFVSVPHPRRPAAHPLPVLSGGLPPRLQFCATGRMGFVRNLTAAQIVDQLLQVHAAAAAEGLGRITNGLMMGMGEPLLNLRRRHHRPEADPAARGRLRRRPAHHRLHGGVPAGDPPAGRGRSQRRPGDLPQRHHRRGPRGADADQPQVDHRRPAGGGALLLPPAGPQGHLRVRAVARRHRHRGRRRAPGRS